MLRIRLLTLAGLMGGAVVLAALATGPRFAPPAAAASTGSVTGQVVWCAPFPLPYGAPGFSGAEAIPDSPSEVMPEAAPDEAPGAAPEGGLIRPVPGPRVPRPIPAGAVLVAVQGTSLSARTDEGGRFRIEGVPTGQYLTVAAGPVRGAAGSVAARPNVFLRESGQSFSVGRLSLGQQCGFYGPTLQGVPGAAGAADAEAEGDIP
jgi:hypothetical protein